MSIIIIHSITTAGKETNEADLKQHLSGGGISTVSTGIKNGFTFFFDIN
jgi:uncharacterized protein (DUF1697 family)